MAYKQRVVFFWVISMFTSFMSQIICIICPILASLSTRSEILIGYRLSLECCTLWSSFGAAVSIAVGLFKPSSDRKESIFYRVLDRLTFPSSRSLISYGNLYTTILIRILLGSGRLRGMLVKLSKVTDTLSHVWQFNVLFNYPKNMKKTNDQSRRRALDQDSRAISMLSRLSESGFSM